MADPSPVDPAPVELAGLSDRALLRMFLQTSDDDAFRVLVERHAALVLGVCRRGLPSATDADDAFQATFVVLARSARKIRRRDSLGSWLYGVATRVCHRIRRDAARRATLELMDIATENKDPLDELLARHDETVADEELNALPESLRTPLVLRYLAGKSNAEVAEELGITVAALEGRLKRGKQRLRMRLLRRGVTLAAVVTILKATRVAACDVPASLVGSTAEICTSAASATIPSLASESTTSTYYALQELNVMNTLIVSKPLVAAIAVSGVAVLAVTAQLAFSQGESSPEAGNVVLDRTVTAADVDPFDAPPTQIVRRAASDTDPFATSGKESTPPAKDGVVFEAGLYVPPNVVDLKPRTPSELRIEAALPRPLTDNGLDFQGDPLDEVAQFLSDEYEIPVVIDERALEELGMAPDEGITVRLRDIKLESALRLMLRPLDLTYVVQNEVLLITSEDVAESNLEARVYPIDFLRTDAEDVTKLLTSTVAPNSWSKTWGLNKQLVGDSEERWHFGGGEATIAAEIPGRLIIRQTYAVHQEINALLAQLKKSTDDSSEARP